MWGYIIGVFVSMWLLQILLSYLQLKHYNKTVVEMSKRHSSGYLGVGINKRKFGVGSVMILVCDKDGYVTDCKTLKGVTVFQRFQENKSFINQHIDYLKEKRHKHFTTASEMAVKNIYSKMDA